MMPSLQDMLLCCLILAVGFSTKIPSIIGSINPICSITYDEAEGVFYELANYGYFPDDFGPISTPNSGHFKALATYCKRCLSNPGNLKKNPAIAIKCHVELENNGAIIWPIPESLVAIFTQVIEGKNYIAYVYFYKKVLAWFVDNEMEFAFGIAPHVERMKRPEYVKIKEIAWNIVNDINLDNLYCQLEHCAALPSTKIIEALVLASGAHIHDDIMVTNAVVHEYADTAVCVRAKDNDYFVHIGVNEGGLFYHTKDGQRTYVYSIHK